MDTPKPLDETQESSAPARPGPRPFAFAEGQVVGGRYRVVRALARGGMGEVYEVEDRDLGEVVALKTLDPLLAGDPTALARFQGEVKSARRVAHPNVCRIFDLGQHLDRDRATPFLTMELLPGESLEQRLRRSPPPPDEALALMRQIAAGVDAAHAVGVVHRDLKPANVVLVPGAAGTRAVVADFGIARRLDQAATQGGWVGTPAYIAPEQLEGRPVGPAADVYAFGVMLFEVATGRWPFEGTSTEEVALPRLSRPAPRARSLNPGLPAAWDEAIARCLEREPGARFASASEAVAALAGVLPGPLPAARSQELSGTKASARRRARPALGAALAAAALLGLGFWAERSRSPLPTAGRVVAVEVAAAEGAAVPAVPAPLPPLDEAAAWVLRRRLAALEAQRSFRVSRDGRGNVLARVRWRPDGDGVAATLEVGAGGRVVRRAEARADSVAGLADALYPALAEAVAGGQPPRALWPEEEEEMRQWAAPDPGAYKELARLFEGLFESYLVDAVPLNRDLVRLIDAHPGWLHPVALWAGTLGVASPEARALAERHLALARPGADPVGEELLRGVAGGAAFRDVSEAVRRDRIGLAMVAALHSDLPADETIARLRTATDRLPELQFGGQAYGAMDHEGQGQAAQKLLYDWLRREPGQPQAWLSLNAHLALHGGPGPAEPQRLFFLLFGRPPTARLVMASAHLARLELAEARELDTSVLDEAPPLRAVALFQLGQVAVAEGRFEQAVEYLARGWEAAEGGGIDFTWTQAAREEALVLELLGREGEALAWRKRQVEAYRRFAWPPAETAALQYLVDRAEGGRCPDQAAHLPPGAESLRRGTERLVRRAAAAHGCGDCAAVLESGVSPNENTLPWTNEYTRCAVELGRGLDGALAVQSRAVSLAPISLTGYPDPAVADVVRAHYWLGRLQEARGERALARQSYGLFVKLWGHADVRLAEVEDARRRLESP